MKSFFKFSNRFILAITLFSTMALNSCKKNNFAVDVDPLAAPTAAQFLPPTGVNTANYYVKSTNAPFYIPVGVTNISSADRPIQLTYTSLRAVAGTQYNAPATVTIKAGAATDSIAFGGLFSGYPTGRKDTVKVKFSGVNTVLNKDSFVLIIQGYCDVLSTNLVGTYPNSTDTYNGAASSKPNYTSSLSGWTPITATSASVILKNIGATPDNGWGYVSSNGGFQTSDPVITPGLSATLDWSNPANFTVTIPTQNYFNDGTGISTINGTGTFSSCDNTLTITCKVKYAGTGGTYTHVTYMKK
jgi:hypothetical protein